MSNKKCAVIFLYFKDAFRHNLFIQLPIMLIRIKNETIKNFTAIISMTWFCDDITELLMKLHKKYAN